MSKTCTHKPGRSLSPLKPRSVSLEPQSIQQSISPERFQPAKQVWDPAARLAALLAPPGSRKLHHGAHTTGHITTAQHDAQASDSTSCPDRDQHADSHITAQHSPFPHVQSNSSQPQAIVSIPFQTPKHLNLHHTAKVL